MLNVTSERFTFESWKHLEPIWTSGLIERTSLINRVFLNPVLVHPPSLPNPALPIQDCSIHQLKSLEQINLNTTVYDLILFTPFLQWTQDVPGMLAQAHNALADGGFFSACFFGQDTLIEFKSVCATLDLQYTDTMQQRFLPTIHTKDAGMLMQRAGFSSPTADIEHLCFSVSSVESLVKNLRNSGFNNSKLSKFSPYLPTTMLDSRFLTDANTIYTQNHPNGDGGLNVSVDLIFMCGWKQSHCSRISA